MSNGLKYQYEVKILQNSNVLNSDVLSHIPAANELIVMSKIFDDYYECEKNLASLLSMLGSVESRMSGKNYIIVSKPNPLIGRAVHAHLNNERAVQDDSWDTHIVLKSFIVDAEILKQSKFDFSVIAQLKVNSDHVRSQSSVANLLEN